MKRRGVRLLAACGLGLVLALPAAALELEPTDRFFVNDYADVITAEAEDAIYAAGVQLYEKTGAQVVAVTVSSLDGEDVRDAGYSLANAWGIGKEGDDTGILLLFAVEDRQVTVEVGSGLEGGIPDMKAGRVLDHYATPKFREDDYSGGMLDAYTALVNEVYIELGQQPDASYTPIEEIVHENDDGGWVFLEIGVILVVLLAVFFGSRHRGGRGGPPIIFFGGRGGGFRGGGFGGGGGGGFSGGGGSFGGGGASRGF